MKRTTKLLLLTVLGTWMAGSAWAIDPDANGVYQIGTADQLIEFANMVNGDASKSGVTAKLTADIDLSGKTYVPIGRDNSRFWGTFDGQGFRVKNMKIVGTTKELGFFSVCSNATIKNLILDASCEINSGNCTAALVGCCNGSGTLTIENVGVECNVTGTGANAAAFVGCNYGGIAIQIKNCYNTGNITGEKESSVFSGWFGNNSNAKVENCWSTGKVTGQDGSNSLGRGIGSGQFVNTYDLNADNDKIQNTILTGYDADWLTSGKLCYTLNGDQSAINWYQAIGTDAYPVPFSSHGQVYANGTLKCDGTSAGGELTYSNSATSVIPPHTYTDGFCSVCGALDKDYMTADTEDYYNLATGNDVKWFAAIVAQVNQSANARLTADIDYTAYKQGFIGISQGTPFRGVFDGQGHTITIDIVNAGSERTGLFAYINAATIKNLVVEGSATSADKNCVGGLGGRSDGNGTLIENVVVKTNVKYTGTNGDATCGGFFANMEATATMKNCAFYGSIDSGSAEGNGGLTGWAGGGNSISIINCLVVPTSYTKNGNSNDFARNNPKVTNSFAVAANDARLASGEMAFMLNEKVSGATVWYQKINTDALPMPIAQEGAVVYANGDLKCDGVTPKEGSELTFSNTEGSNVDNHQFNDWGFCTVCDAVQPDYMTAADGVYTVENAKQLNWLANYAGKVDPTVKVVLGADIDMAEVVGFPGFGTEDKRFSSSIDGQKHIIKNLTMNMGDGRAAGLIRFATAPLTVKNLTIDASCSFKAKNYAGAFIGDLNGNGAVTLEQLGNEANVTVTDQNPGGIVGCNFSGEAKITMLNCYNAGTITAGWEGGGLSGWLGNGAKMTNCYNMGEVVKGEAFARGNDQVKENCFDTSSTPAEDFTNGTVFAALFDASNVWRMDFDATTAHPVLYEPATLVMKEDFPNRFVAGETADVKVYRAMTADDDWNTLCLPFNADASLFSAIAELIGVEGTTLKFETATAIEAGKAYLVKPAANITEITATGVELKAVTPTTVTGYAFTGIYEPTAIDEGDLFVAAYNKLTPADNSGNKLKGFRAYFDVTGTGARATSFVVDDTTTGIIGIDGTFVENGKIYNLNGQKVQNAQKGLYIVNGKKVVVK